MNSVLKQPEIIKSIMPQGTWAQGYLAGIKSMLLVDPARYRGFGPYWEAVKGAFISHDDFTFGDSVNMETFQAVDYGSDDLNLAAAYLYEGEAVSAMRQYEKQHLLEDVDGNSFDWFSGDEEMEIRVAMPK